MKKVLFITTSIILIFGLLFGCNSQTPKVDTPPVVEEPNNDQESNENNSGSEENTSVTKEGVYSGRIDNHSAEIMINGQPVAVQVGNVVDQIEQLNEGDPVIFTYVENESGQIVLTNIKRDEANSGDINTGLTKEGVYSGRIDNHSAEIMIDGQPVAVQIEKVVDQIEQLNEGDYVIFTYEENQVGQIVLTTIKLDNCPLTKEGIYSGQIDNHSVEIMIDGKPVAVQIGKVVDQIEQLNEGDTVIFTYIKNEHGQMVLTDIRKK